MGSTVTTEVIPNPSGRGRGEDQAVGGQEFWALDLAAKDGDLVAESEEFEVALSIQLSAQNVSAQNGQPDQ